MGVFEKLKAAKNMATTIKELEKIMGETNLDSEPDINEVYENIKKSTGIDLSGLDSLPQNMTKDMTPKLEVKFKNTSSNEDPKFNHKDDSGFDFRANLPEGSVILKSLERTLIPTGLSYELPENYELQVRPRSGLAIKKGLTVLNTPGTVDSDYRGEIKVIIYNHGNKDFIINNKDRIAQMVLTPVIKIKLEETENLPKTVRGESGFGSTGK